MDLIKQARSHFFGWVIVCCTLLQTNAQEVDWYKYATRLPHSDSFKLIGWESNFFQSKNLATIEKLQRLLTSASAKKITIAHFGDSHVQLDHCPSLLRTILQENYGDAGRGMFFPFGLAKTYSHIDFTTSFTGKWATANSIQTPPKIPVGVTGFVASTSDNSASFNIRFNRRYAYHPVTIRLLYHPLSFGYTISLSSGNTLQTVWIDTADVTHKGYIDFSISQLTDSLQFVFNKTSSDSAEFAFYGISIENNQPGILYHNLGVGGANFSAMLYQKYFFEQMKIIQPDWVILDWGTNDIIYKNQIEDSLESNIIKCIRMVRAAQPNALIMLTSVQDMNWKGKNVTACLAFSNLINRIAREQDCLFYDWYYVAGGKQSMKTWEKLEWGRKDNIHLTAAGYRVKAKLLYEALQNSFVVMKENNQLKELLIARRETTDSIIKYQEPEVVIDVPNKVKVKESPQKKKKVTYVVKKGDSLGAIAKKFKTTVSVLKKKNRLIGNRLSIGQILIIQ